METIQPQSRADRSSGVDQCGVMQGSAVFFVYYSAGQGSAVYFCILQCSAERCSMVMYVAVQCNAVQGSAVQCSGMESDSAIIPGQLDPL